MTHSTKQTAHQGMPPFPKEGAPLSFFEFWPAWLFYAPIKAYGLWLALRYGGLNTITAANPAIMAGGFVGETKSEIDALLRKHLSAYLPESTFIAPPIHEEQVLKQIKYTALSYPIIAKPDAGCRGLGVQKLLDINELKTYIKAFPKDQPLVLQNYIDWEGEAGVFYIRHPESESGFIPSLTLKYFPYVYGDGYSTLKELICNDPRAGKLSDMYLPKHKERLETIPAKGKEIRLCMAGAHSKGAIFKDGTQFVTPQMNALFDRLAKNIEGFYFGRFDVRFKDFSDLETGENLKIIELNGVGAEMTHIWDSRTSLMSAYRTLCYQFKTAFEIGAANKKKGAKPMPLKELFALIKSYRSSEDQFPPTH